MAIGKPKEKETDVVIPAQVIIVPKEDGVVSDVRVLTETVLEPHEEDTDENEPEKTPLRADFSQLLKVTYGELADEGKTGVYLDFGGHDVHVFADSIEISSAIPLGDADAPDFYNQPGPKKIGNDLLRLDELSAELMPNGYNVIHRGLAIDGSYEIVHKRNVQFEFEDALIAHVGELKTILDTFNIGAPEDSEIPESN